MLEGNKRCGGILRLWNSPTDAGGRVSGKRPGADTVAGSDRAPLTQQRWAVLLQEEECMWWHVCESTLLINIVEWLKPKYVQSKISRKAKTTTVSRVHTSAEAGVAHPCVSKKCIWMLVVKLAVSVFLEDMLRWCCEVTWGPDASASGSRVSWDAWVTTFSRSLEWASAPGCDTATTRPHEKTKEMS